MADNLNIWDSLAKTDPSHTKPFNRAGGFKGTAIKPIWIIKMLTERFGAIGVGWGTGEPSFQVVNCDGEILVFCTVQAWHTDRTNVFYGVGGDKVQAKRKDSSFCDDEAFKKAFTDATNNAFKFLGVGADVHMGLFDDDKYVTAAKEEFGERSRPAPALIDDAQWAELTTLIERTGADLQGFLTFYKITSLQELPAAAFSQASKALSKKLAA